jgi:ZIP family zinc transporter
MNKELWTSLGVIFIFLMTTLGSSLVFFFKKDLSSNFKRIFLGFASGIMIAASIFSLLIPAINEPVDYMPSWLVVAISFVAGCLFLFGIDKLVPHLHKGMNEEEGLKTKRMKSSTKMFLAVLIHNIPEGLAVGLAFGLVFTGASNTDALLMSALMLALGMGIQNFPEGAAVALPMMEELKSKPKAFFYGALTGIVEPIAAVVGIFLSMYISGIMPWALAFAAGCMIYVTIEELIPEMQLDSKNHLGTWACIAGFVVMMVLDIALAF